jgi:3-isopropylmalate/(R)-2-methylmalate dehydratase small subunit
MIIKGKVHKFGDNINTDDIIAAKYLDSQDPKFLGPKCMENIDPKFSQRVKKGDIIVAGKNFGCGSSREHAPLAIKGCGVALVIAESFARIFYRNAINVGLPILVCKEAKRIKAQISLRVDLARGLIQDRGGAVELRSENFPVFMQEIIKSGGLMPWLRKNKRIQTPIKLQ